MIALNGKFRHPQRALPAHADVLAGPDFPVMGPARLAHPLPVPAAVRTDVVAMDARARDVAGDGRAVDDPVLRLSRHRRERDGEWGGDGKKQFHKRSLSFDDLSLPNAP